jgi:hypothetical protein
LEKYQQHYSLWKVWVRDLIQAVDRDGSDKRQKYLLGQTVEQMEEMERLLVEEKRDAFLLLIEDLRGVEKDLERPAPNTFSIRMRIERNAGKVRHGFAPDSALVVSEP